MTSRTRWVPALLAVAALVLSGCGGGGGGATEKTESGADKVTVGVIPIIDVAPIYLGEDQGFFDDEDIDLSLESGQGGAAILPGVQSGQFQFGFSNNTSLLVAKEQGIDVQVVAPGNSSTGEVGDDFSAVVAQPGSGITDATDLEGKRVAVNTLDNIGSTTINKAVRDAGGDPSSIKYVELGFPDMPGALAGGQVDAAWVVEPFLTITTGQGAKPVVWNFAEASGDGSAPLMIASYFTTGATAEANGDLVDRFSAAMEKSLAYAEENPDEVRRILRTYTELDQQTAEQVTLPSFPTEVDEGSFELLAELAQTDDALDGQPDVSSMLP